MGRAYRFSGVRISFSFPELIFDFSRRDWIPAFAGMTGCWGIFRVAALFFRRVRWRSRRGILPSLILMVSNRPWPWRKLGSFWGGLFSRIRSWVILVC